MEKLKINIIGIGIIYILTLLSCKSQMAFYEGKKVITEACELNNRINDTIVIRGIYYNCMEYSGFQSADRDLCQQNFDMELNFEQTDMPKELLDKIYKIEGCTANIKMTLLGILKNDSQTGYGHLGSNNSELIVLKSIEIGKLKYIRP